MKKYALVLLDNDKTEFSAVCEEKKTFFKKNPKGSSYVDIITGETIKPSESTNTGLTYSNSPKMISNIEVYKLLLIIKSIGINAYYDHIMEIKNSMITANNKFTK